MDICLDAAFADGTATLEPIEFGTAMSLIIGEDIYSIGTAFDINLRNSITKGIISGIDREVYGDYKLIQSDFAANPGFSGGPLIDSEGKVVGMISFKYKENKSEGNNQPT